MVNNEGNAEIMGVVLLISIFVAAVALMGVSMLSAPQPEKVPAVAFDFWSDENHTSVSLVHRGGETLNLNGTVLKVTYSNGTTSENPSVIIDGGTPDYWTHISSSSSSSPYSIGDVINLTAPAGSIDQVQLIWPGTGAASMTGGGGPVLLGAWSPNGSSGKNPPAAVTGAVPVTFPYSPEGPTWTQPTQTPAVPWVYFIADITATNGTAPITFTDRTENGDGYPLRIWNFGDGENNFSNVTPIIHTYATPSIGPFVTYPVTLYRAPNGTTITEGQPNMTRPHYITVYQKPTALFTPDPTEGNAPLNVTFTDNSSGYVSHWNWDSGEGKPAETNQSAWHIYTTNGFYAVVLTVSNPFEVAPPSAAQFITVHPQVIATFTATPMTGPAPLTVSFNGSSSGGDNLTYSWEFGDGSLSNEIQPIHTYTIAGNYTVNLTVNNTLPGPNTSTTSRNITVTAPPLVPPVANFTATPMNGTAPLAVKFNDTSTNAPTSWNWSFGDGTYATQQNPPVHTYTIPGAYTVTLTASNAAGSNFTTKTILVYNNQDTIRVNAGGGSYTDCLGKLWLADQQYTPGRWGYSPAGAPVYSMDIPSIDNTSDPTLYRTSRWSNTGTVEYQFNVPNGDYTVQLKFAETDADVVNSTQRTFDVTVNDEMVANDFNIYTTAGLNTATDLYWTRNVTGNLIHIVLTSTTGQPMIAAIGIAPASTGVSPDFIGSPQIGNAPLTVNFTDKTTGTGINGWFWDFGDSTTNQTEQHEQNPQHTYAAAGTYNVTLTAGNDNQSRTVVKTNYITVGPALTADFTANTTTGIAPLAVGFTDRSIGNGINNWSWNFGDGNTSNAQNATHTYTSPGTYTVNLTISNPYGSASTTKTGFITIHSLNPDFRGNQTTGNAPLTVSFTDTSTGDINIDTWTWNFGDGNTSTTQNPVYQYQKNGTYDVSLRITNTTLGTNTTTKLGYITVLPQLFPNFTANTTAGNAPLTVQFTDNSTGSSINGWNWDFGDLSPAVTTQNPAHTYTTNGTYTVTLTINNTYGNATTTKTGFVTVYPPLVAAFGGAPLLGNAPLNVSFVDQSTGYTIDGWNWSFGDGNTSTKQNPSHIYTAAGNYTVDLTVNNTYGNATVSKPAFVTVLPQLVANFMANQTIGNAQLPVRFNDTSAGNPTSWSWDFGDNTTASDQNVTHTYPIAGNYTVNLTISNGYGNNTTTRTRYITVLNPLVAAFNGTPTIGNGQVNTQFTDQSSGDSITNWNWNFGDGNSSIIRNASHSYTTPGIYNVTLTINNTYGISSTTKNWYITVYPPLIANFTTTTQSGVAPLEVDFTDISTGYLITNWNWTFGDGSQTGTSQNTSYTYTKPGTYTVTLVVTNSLGQSAPATRTITVTPPPTTTPIPSGGVISGTIYNDQNGDGYPSTSDPKLAGWTINLIKNGNVIKTTMSNTTGAYGFYGLETGWYTVKEVLPVGWQGTNPSGGTSSSMHINQGNKDSYPNTDFWNYYKPVTTGGNIYLLGLEPGYLVKGGYFQFRDTLSDSGFTGVWIDQTYYPVNQGETVELILNSDTEGYIQISNKMIRSFDVQDVTLKINNTIIKRGDVTDIEIPGYDSLVSGLTVTASAPNLWTTFRVNNTQIIPRANNSIRLNLYNVTTDSQGVLDLYVGSMVWIHSGSAGTYQVLP